MNKLLLAIIFSVLSITSTFSQFHEIAEFGNPTEEELAMMEYPENPEASGVILYERGDYRFETGFEHIMVIKNVHRKIKVIDPKSFNEETVSIHLYQPERKRSEHLREVKAITHNGNLQNYVTKDAIFHKKVDDLNKVVTFAFPDIKKGSIIEYTYTIESPFLYSLDGWQFQNLLPTLYSEIHTEIPANYKYNRSLVGKRKLDVEESKNKRNCFYINSNYSKADCEMTTYGMFNIPAYSIEEYMLSKDNYIPAIYYELRNIIGFDGRKNSIAKSWESVEDELRLNSSVGRQLNRNNFVKNQLPEEILKINDPLERAKEIYVFIRDYFSWNGNTQMFTDSNVREAFKEQRGNVSEINLTLVNAFQAADLEAHIMLSVTRDRRLPAELYPVLSDYNYATAFLKIGNNEYVLDATEKLMPFGMLPMRALNMRGRVMDFDNGSFWHTIEPYERNIHFTQCSLTLKEDGTIEGDAKETLSGLLAFEKREELGADAENEVRIKKELGTTNLEVNNVVIENKKKANTPLTVAYDVSFVTEEGVTDIYFNPFFLQRHFRTNPFKSESRQFPIDFGYPIRLIYLVTLDIPSSYAFKNIPESQTIKLQEAGEIAVAYQSTDTKLSVRLTFNLNDYRYHTEAYGYVRDFFENLASLQDSSIISIEKLD